MTQWRSEFRPMPIAPQPVLHGPLADLLEWQAMAQGAYSANTLRAQKADGAIFQAYCESVAEAYLPANPHTVRAFIGAQVKAGKKPATIQRYVATISRVHTAAHLHNPCSSEAVRLGLKRMGREISARQDQAHPWAGKRSRSLSRARARDCALIENARFFASPMRRSRDGANWWRLK